MQSSTQTCKFCPKNVNFLKWGYYFMYDLTASITQSDATLPGHETILYWAQHKIVICFTKFKCKHCKNFDLLTHTPLDVIFDLAKLFKALLKDKLKSHSKVLYNGNLNLYKEVKVTSSQNMSGVTNRQDSKLKFSLFFKYLGF